MGVLRGVSVSLVLFFFFSVTVFAQLEITEIMYAPEVKVNGIAFEYVEIFIGNYTNLSGYLVADEAAYAGKKSNLTELQPHSSGYALLVEQGFNLTGIPASIYSVAKIGRGLNDGGDSVFLFFPNGMLITAVNFTRLEKTSNGNSLQLINGTWQAASPTPGLRNEVQAPLEPTPSTENIVLSPHLSSPLYLGVLYDDLFHIEIAKENCSEKDNVTVAYTIHDETGNLLKNATFTREKIGCSTGANTGSFTPTTPGTIAILGRIIESTVPEDTLEDNAINFSLSVVDPATISCDSSLSVVLNETLFHADGEKITFTPKPTNTTFPFRIEYWIEDLFGTVIKSRVNTTNANQKSWTAQSNEDDRVYLLKAQLYPSCLDESIIDNAVEKLLIVRKDAGSLSLTSPGSSETPSIITINEITPSNPRFGDMLQVKLDVVKGSTSKYAVALWAESKGRRISAETKMHLREENTEYSLALPVQLNSRCADEQDATLIVEGLGVRTEKAFTIAGADEDACAEEEEEDAADASDSHENGAGNLEQQEFAFRLLALPATVPSGSIFPVSVFLQGDDEEHDYAVWAYLYRGSRCYSCADGKLPREQLLQEGTLDAFAEKILAFELPIDAGLAEGEYKLKVKLLKDDLKTPQEITETIHIAESADAPQPAEKSTFSPAIARTAPAESPGVVVYESNTAKAKSFTPFVLFTAMGLLVLVLLRG